MKIIGLAIRPKANLLELSLSNCEIDFKNDVFSLLRGRAYFL